MVARRSHNRTVFLISNRRQNLQYNRYNSFFGDSVLNGSMYSPPGRRTGAGRAPPPAYSWVPVLVVAAVALGLIVWLLVIGMQTKTIDDGLSDCAPVYSIPSGGLLLSQPGCWTFQNDVPCDEEVCIYVLSHGVAINGGGFDLLLGQNTTGILVAGAPDILLPPGPPSPPYVTPPANFRLSDLRVMTDPPSFASFSIGLLAFSAPSLTIERCIFNGTAIGAFLFDADDAHVVASHFTEIKHRAGVPLDEQPAYFFALAIAGGYGIAVSGCDFLHVDGLPAVAPESYPYQEDFALVVESSFTTGLPARGVTIEDCSVVDGASVYFYQVEGLTIDKVEIITLNPDDPWSALSLNGVNSGSVKHSAIWNPDANRFFDGGTCSPCQNVIWEDVDIFCNAAGGYGHLAELGGQLGPYGPALLHIGSGYYSYARWRPQNLTLEGTGGGVTVKNCHLSGGYLPDSYPQQNMGVFVDGPTTRVTIRDTIVENCGGYIPVNASIDAPELPGGAIVVSPGSSFVTVSGCELYTSANGSPRGGNGILFMGAEIVSSDPNLGAIGLTFFPPSSNCTAFDNKIFFNAGCAIWNDGLYNYIYGNAQGGNWAGTYCGGGTFAPVVVAPGSPALAGQNI